MINYLIDHGAKPNNEKNANTLTFAVRFENLEIIKLLCKNNANPYNNTYKYIDNNSSTLYHAILTKDPQIVHQIVSRGGTYFIGINLTNNPYYQGADAIDLLEHRHEFRNCSLETFDRMINLIMCSGSQLKTPVHIYEIINRNSYIMSKRLDCYKVLNVSIIHDLIKKEHIDKFKMELKNTMDDLIKNPYLLHEIECALTILPKCLIDEINKFCNETLVKYIDWS